MSGVDVPELLQGRYEIGAVVGAGGMARVHRATDAVLGRDVAVKIFRADVDAGDARRMQEESRTLAALNHPGLVGIFDAGATEAGAPYLVMELVEGPTLAQCCLDGTLPADDLARIGAELADALAHVHERGVVHRDVKPANILLDAAGRPKLTDFGIARLVDGAAHTATGLTIGTAPYLSPEQVTGKPVGPPTDVYALGLVLLECLTGQREYPGNGVEAALARLHRPPRIPGTLPAPWPALLHEMTALAPRRRPSAADVARALRAGATGTTGVEVTAPPTAVLADPEPRTARLPSRPVVAARTRRPVRPSRALSLEALRDKPVRVGLLLVALLALVLVIAVTASSGPSTSPSPAGSSTGQLDRDLNELQKAVRP